MNDVFFTILVLVLMIAVLALCIYGFYKTRSVGFILLLAVVLLQPGPIKYSASALAEFCTQVPGPWDVMDWFMFFEDLLLALYWMLLCLGLWLLIRRYNTVASGAYLPKSLRNMSDNEQ